MNHRIRLVAGVALIVFGFALLGWAIYAGLNPTVPFETRLAPLSTEAAKDIEVFELGADRLQQIEVSAKDERRPLATGIVARDDSGRLTPLVWRNQVTEAILFSDASTEDAMKVLAAIREHIPRDAVVLAWWDFSRAIRLVAGRAAPLDDAQARGLLLPATWSAAAASERARWGAGVPASSVEVFTRFIDALLDPDEARASESLKKLADNKPAYLAVRISDVWKLAAAQPQQLSIAYKDFAATGVSHGLIKSAQQWLRDEKIEGGFAVEPMGGATRLHYFQRKSDGDRLIARLLPFSTSLPTPPTRLSLVYQHKGWWIYRLND
ncbi:MAG: hydroxylamine oxidation protein HaoB [Alphaproteobacteria bacterium]|nr:hydroxylamine oxidation protein HaoB [Alphaproteobacteria bacterium]MBM3641419.1 hydroxylamine oxidation protein HaoB [Alphaproteobacteria bacterium]